MKHLYIILLCVFSITSCLATHYFEPEIIEISKTEDKISYLGDTCWFEIKISAGSDQISAWPGIQGIQICCRN